MSTPIRTLYLQIPQWILFSIHIVPQQNLLAENAYGGRLWWVGILVGGQTKQTNALFGNGWPFPNNTRGKQERLHHLPLAGQGGNFDRQPARGSVEDGLLQFALTQFRPFYLLIKSGNFGRFIGL